MDLNDLRKFKGKKLVDVEEDIKKIATAHMLTLNIEDAKFNPNPIMTDPSRLNIYTDAEGVVTRWSIG